MHYYNYANQKLRFKISHSAVNSSQGVSGSESESCMGVIIM